MNGKELYRLAKKRVLRSIRDTGEIYESPNKNHYWEVWTTLDPVGLRRIDAIVDILVADGWLVLGR